MNNDWVLDTESGILTIMSLENIGWNESGCASYNHFGGWGSYSNCVREVQFTGGIRGISQRAFANHTSLENITIPASVTSLTSKVFLNCLNLKSIGFLTRDVAIHAEAFTNCSSLERIYLYRGSTADSYFSSSKYTKIYYDDIVYPENYEYLLNSDGESITIKKYYGSETELTIPDTIDGEKVTAIGDYAFTSCYSLTSVTIPNSVMSIGDYAFSSCDGLTSVTIPSNVETVGVRAFNGCSSLKRATINTSVVSDYAFSSCSSLASVTILANVSSIGSGVFNNCSSIAGITVVNTNTNYKTVDGILFDIDMTELIKCPAKTALTEYFVPNTVTSIGDGAFDCCLALEDIIIDDGVTNIGEIAFYGCESLTSVIIPNSVNSIGQGAFSGCSALTDITIGNGVTVIGDNAFYGCKNLKKLYVSDIESWLNVSLSDMDSHPLYYFGGNLYVNNVLAKDIIIPDGVASIGRYSFYQCDSLTSVIIPDSVTSIGVDVFYACSKLTSIYVVQGSYGETWAKNNYSREVKYIVSLDMTAGKIEAGNSLTLTASIADIYTGDKTVTWTSSNEAVATVKNGVVSGVSEGTAVIKAEIPGGHYATCDVTVTDFSKIADRFLKFEGYQLRESGYNGLRSGFVVDFDGLYALEGEGYTVLEYGTILAATEKLTKNGDDFTVFKGSDGSYGTLSYAKLFTIYKNYSYVGKYVSFDENELVYYCTVTHFNAETYDKEVTIRGYAVIADSEGNEYVVYADYPNEAYRSVSLMQMCLEMKAKGLIDPLTCISYLDVEKFMNASGKYGDEEVEENDFFG